MSDQKMFEINMPSNDSIPTSEEVELHKLMNQE